MSNLLTGDYEAVLQVAIRQLQHVHAMTHPGARRRRRGAQTDTDIPIPHPEPIDAPEAFLAVLDAEVDEDEHADVAADASRRR